MDNYLGGYAGKVLRVDLTGGRIKEERFNINVLKDFVGGTGIGAKVLYDEVPANADPFSPENRLIFSSGPLGGTAVPGSGTFAVITQSPLTGLSSAAHANGFFGARLKYAGYDAIIIQGQSAKWVYLDVTDKGVELRDAERLLGKDTWETEEILRAEHGQAGMDVGLSVACIGIAGENMVRFAAVCSDFGHVASSGGAGAVMGSKRLKAITVSGSKGVPIFEKDAGKVLSHIKEWIKGALESPFGKAVSTLGTAGFFSAAENLGWLPVKNLTSNTFPLHTQFNGDYLRKTFKTRPRACHACPFAHCLMMEVTTGPYKGLIAEEPEYEGLAAWGSNVGILDPGTAVKINNINDRLGMDLKEATFCLSLAMECYEKGILSKDDLDGLDLSWGNAEAVMELLEMTAQRRAFGDILAEGVMRAAQKIGKGALDLAVYVKKGFAPHVHDPRGRWGILFAQAMSNMGSIEATSLEIIAAPDLGFPQPIPLFSHELLPKAQSKAGPKRQFEDCLGVCMFLCQGPMQTILDTLNAITGLGFDKETALMVGERIINLLRLFNIRQGLTPDHDSISFRLGEAPKEGVAQGKSIGPFLEDMRKNYYKLMGWDELTGQPLPDTLKRLGLNW